MGITKVYPASAFEREFIPGFANEELMTRVGGNVVMQLEAVVLADRYEETGERIELASAPRCADGVGTYVATVNVFGLRMHYQLVLRMFHQLGVRVHAPARQLG